MTGRSALLGVALLAAGCAPADGPAPQPVSYAPPAAAPATTNADATRPAGDDRPVEDDRAAYRRRERERIDRLAAAAEAKPLDMAALQRAAVAIASPAPAAAADSAADDRAVRLAGATLTAPAGWVRERPLAAFLLATFRLPRVAGDPDDALLTITAADPADAGVEPALTLAEGAEGGVRYGALDATLHAGGRAFAVHCSGPERTVAARAEEVRAFLRTLRPAD